MATHATLLQKPLSSHTALTSKSDVKEEDLKHASNLETLKYFAMPMSLQHRIQPCSSITLISLESTVR